MRIIAVVRANIRSFHSAFTILRGFIEILLLSVLIMDNFFSLKNMYWCGGNPGTSIEGFFFFYLPKAIISYTKKKIKKFSNRVLQCRCFVHGPFPSTVFLRLLGKNVRKPIRLSSPLIDVFDFTSEYNRIKRIL